MKKKKFKSLELYVKSILNNFNVGSHLSILKDSTSEVDSVRQYQSGDKKLDSRSSLKSCLAMSRTFNPEKEIVLYLLLDISCSQMNKIEMAINICLFLSYLSEMSFDRISLITFSDKINDVVLPSNDNKNINFILEKIYNNFEFNKGSDVECAMNYLLGLNPNNAMIFLISDFAYEFTKKFSNSLKQISSNSTNKFIGMATLDLSELKFKSNMNCYFSDSESGELVNLNNKNLCGSYNSWLNNIKINFNKCNSDFIILHKDLDYLNQIAKYLLRK